MVLVERVQERSSYLDARGLGNLIEIDIDLIRDDAPSAEATSQTFSACSDKSP